MTVPFRIERLVLDTVNGNVTHTFSRDLTVLSGRTGVGKTSLLELLKFALGGDAQLAPVTAGVSDVHLDLNVGDLRLQLSRALDNERRKTVRVVDLTSGQRMPDHSVDGDEPSLSGLLLAALGLESGLRAAARGGRSTSAGNRVTFNDVLKFIYVPQIEMNHDIALSEESYYTPKRMTVFELLFNLTSASLLQMRSEINTLKSQIEEANREVTTVKKFLADTNLTSRFDAEIAQAAAQAEENAARVGLAQLQRGLEQAVDRQSQVLRDMLTDAEQALADARDLAQELTRQQADYRSEARRVADDLDRLVRMESAGIRLANIEFSLCPRCTQRLDTREVPEGACRVCQQPDIVAGIGLSDQFEAEQLRAQLEEIDGQIAVIENELGRTESAAGQRQGLIVQLTQKIDERTAGRVTPRLQAYADAVGRLERSRAEQGGLELALRQWDRAEELAATANDLVTRRARLQTDLNLQEQALAVRKRELFDELDLEFQSTVADFGIPGVESASISPDSYLPLLNGQSFERMSLGGGIITATQVAYWMALVTVAARLRDNHYPMFLMLDSPRTALNAEDDIAAQMYRRFALQAQAVPGRLQFIVADNVLPRHIDRTFDEFTFTYDSPTIGTLEHPGLENVRTLSEGQVDDAGSSSEA